MTVCLKKKLGVNYSYSEPRHSKRWAWNLKPEFISYSSATDDRAAQNFTLILFAACVLQNVTMNSYHMAD